jgi:peptidyl-dipeptidase A
MKIRAAACIACTFAAMAFAADPKATPAEARKFINDAEQKLLLLGVDSSRADWIKSTYITDDTEAIAAKLDEKAIAATVEYAKQATRFDGLKLDPETARKLKLLKLSLTIATPADARESAELTRIVTGMEGTYGKGKYCPRRSGSARFSSSPKTATWSATPAPGMSMR